MASTAPISSAARTEPAVETAARPPAPSVLTPAERQPLTRLLIEEVDGEYVYKIVDRNSGRVLTELPRGRVEELGDQEAYNAGAVVSTRA